MIYVYVLQSLVYHNQFYVGSTINIEQHLSEHNSGKSTHTAKFKPWQLLVFIAFNEKSKAAGFEKYLKTSAGKAFANKRLW